jgi:hypothetical protein
MSYVLATGLPPATIRELTALELEALTELLTKRS